jgi:hypothetical protein
MLCRGIEQPPRRYVVDSDEVHPEFLHQPEVLRGPFWRGDQVAIGIRPKWAISDALEEPLAIAFLEELGANANGQ